MERKGRREKSRVERQTERERVGEENLGETEAASSRERQKNELSLEAEDQLVSADGRGSGYGLSLKGTGQIITHIPSCIK